MNEVSVASTKDGIILQGLPTDAVVWVYDMTGKLLMSSNSEPVNGVMQIDVPAQGVYNIRVVSTTDARTIKTVIR